MLSKKIVKYIQSLRHKKFRDEEGVFIAEGPKVVDEFLMSKNTPCKMICGGKDWLLENESLLKNIPSENIFEADDHWLKAVSFLKTPNKVVGVFYQKSNVLPILKGKISLMIDDLQDPGNLGTIIRIADWFAIENIICSDHSVDCYNPKVVQSTMGSLSRVNVFYCNLVPFIENHKAIPMYATTLAGTSVFQLPKIKEAIILIGNESNGVHESLLQLVPYKITIPKYGQAESLNAAVATGIILSQIISN